MEHRFEESYVELLAALWGELEQLALIVESSNPEERECFALRAMAFLIELDLLSSATDRWRDRQWVSPLERIRIRDVVSALRDTLDWTALDEFAPRPVGPILAAQNRLFDEIEARSTGTAAALSRTG